ncbi:MAG: tyrosine--tRNA ligase [Candidatus Paceibacterota bacterium]|jgi:tyrosyl-tRNA synthetase
MKLLSEELQKRGFIYQFSEEKLEDITDKEKRTLYVGIDPTADSLHVGHLVALLMLRHFQSYGHKIIIIVGGATGMIGDPSGKSKERNLLDNKTLKKNVKGIKAQVKSILGNSNFTITNNNDWFKKIKVLDFLRDTGKHFTINALIKRDSIEKRMTGDEGISYTEFSYVLLQSYDFLHLFKKYGCNLQIGGSDQWGNIVSGIDLIRKVEDKKVYGITCPLIINEATGEKFGKSEGGNVWLSAERTSSFAFFQFWLNVDDKSAVKYLKIYSPLSIEKINGIENDFIKNPENRLAQKSLAYEMTKLIHGEQSAIASKKVSEILFENKEIENLSQEEKKLLTSEIKSVSAKIGDGIKIADALVMAELTQSKGEAGRLLKEGGVSVNNEKVDEEYIITSKDSKNGIILIKKGKKNFACLLV